MILISFRRFRRSLSYAIRGLRTAYRQENSFRIHVLVAAVVVVFLIVFRVRSGDAALVILLISTMLSLELVNTVVERFVDLLEPRVHPYVGIVKDLMAAAIMIAAVTSMVIAALLLLPYLGIHF